MQKQLADTDSIYCANVTNSHQSSVFIAATDSIEACSVFGDNYESNMDVVIVLSKDNLRLNLLSHFLKGTTYYKRGSNTKWTLDKKWLLDRDAAVDKVFRAKYGKFHASVNKEVSRTYLKGITALKSDEHGNKLDLREYLFSGDIIELVRQKDGSIFLTVQGCGGEFKFESVNLLKEFEDWLTNVHKKTDGKPLGATAIGSYIRALDVSTKQNPDGSPASNHGKVVWHNIYQHLHGNPAPKGVFQIDNLAEFDTMFGPLKLAVNKGDAPPNVVSQHFTEIQQWIAGQTGGAFLPPALDLYGKFLQWREGQQKKEKLPSNVDRLSIALKLFEEKRGAAEHDRSYDENTARIRTQGQIIDGDYLVGSDYVSFRKTLHDRQIANSYFAKHTDEDKWKLGEFMAAVRNDPKDISYYLSKENRPKVSGVGDMLLTAFLTRVRPDLYAFYSNPLFVSVKLFGMTNDDALPQMTLGSYNTYKGIQTIIRDRMREMGIKAENGNDADYLTVNEFTWFVYDNLNLVKEAMPPEFRVPENVDRLSIALKLFAKKRKEDGEDGWLETGRAVNGRIREYFDPLTEETIGAFGEEQIEELFCGKKSADGKVEFVTMWSGKNGQGWGHIKKGLDDGKLSEIVGYLVSLKHGLEIASQFCLPDFDWHYGFGRSVISELLMKFHPENCIKHGERSYNALAWLRLIDFSWVRKYSSEEYSQVCGAAAKILAKMKAMDMPRQINADGTEDDSPPDYLTVNEFLYFVDTNLDKIQEEVMSKAMKPADYSKSTNQPKAKKPQVNLSNAEDVVLLRLAAALRAKPFAILAGHSGTGKSRMVRKLAYMTCARGGYKALLEGADGKPAATPGNFCMVQVKPNWHDSTDLLGYYSEIGSAFRTTDFVKFICKAYAYPDVPFFVCLDEMNLAPVEQYFAEYLSAIESRKVKDDAEFLDGNGDEKTGPKVITDTLLDKSVWKSASDLGCEFTQSAYWVEKHGLTIPRNLFVVGTVNMDESTNQFSRKVLDRAFTLEMTDADFEHFGEKNPELSYSDFAGDDFAKALLDGEVVAKKPEAGAPQQEKDAFANQVKKLTSLQPVLDGTSFVVAYRFANEYMLYANALGKMCDVMDVSGDAAATSGEANPVEAAAKRPDAFDDMILMKVLPRITGDTEMVMRIFAGDPGQDKEPRALDDPDVGGLAKLLGKESASFGKMKEIVKRGESSGSGTLTFWP